MFQPVEFYRTFMTDFFLYKQVIYKNILDNYDEAEPLVLKGVTGQIKADVLKVLKSSIRVTYYHSIETLFEIMFAIESGIRTHPNPHQDELILQRLSNSDFQKNFQRIEKIAASDTEELKKFDETIFIEAGDENISLLDIFSTIQSLLPTTPSVLIGGNECHKALRRLK